MMKKDQGVTRLPPAFCPFCGYYFDATGTADGSPSAPQPGNIAVCLNCAELLVFETEALLRKLSAFEQAEAATAPDWQETREAQETLRAMQRQGFQTAQAERGRPRRH